MENRPSAAAGGGGLPSLGRYHLGEPLGGGPTGEVFRAKVYGVAGYERQYAVKRFHAALAGDPRAAETVAAAARVYASISHPYIGRLHEYGVAAGQMFVAVDLVNGVDLPRLLSSSSAVGDPVPRGALLAMVGQIARGVAYAHGRGVVHGGICPTNVIFSADGDPKVVDFGFLRARLRGRPASDVTLAARMPYLAPEQLDGHEATPATDVFQLATLAYEILLGERAFTGKTPDQIESSVLAGPRETPDIPPLVWEVLQGAFDRDPKDRFSHAGELADALEAVARRMALPGGRSDMAAAVKRAQARSADLLANSSGALSFPLPSPPPSVPGVQLSHLFTGGEVPRPGPRTTLSGLGVQSVRFENEPPSARPASQPAPVVTPAAGFGAVGKDPPSQKRRRTIPPPPPADAVRPPLSPSASRDELAMVMAPPARQAADFGGALVARGRRTRWPWIVLGMVLVGGAGAVVVNSLKEPGTDTNTITTTEAGTGTDTNTNTTVRADAGAAAATAAVVPTAPADAAGVAAAAPDATVVAVAPPAPEPTPAPPEPTPVTPTPEPAPVTPTPEPAPAPVAPTPTPTPVPPPSPSANLVILTRPEGAAVYLDGAAKGKTPLELPATGDKHKLAVLLGGYKLVKQDIQGRGKLDIELEKAQKLKGKAGIKIKCVTRNRYYVIVDGVHTGLFCPTERINVDVGEHTVEIYDTVSDATTFHKVPVRDTHFSVRVTVEP